MDRKIVAVSVSGVKETKQSFVMKSLLGFLYSNVSGSELKNEFFNYSFMFPVQVAERDNE